jgi:phospholipid transport system substrate-binding protein
LALHRINRREFAAFAAALALVPGAALAVTEKSAIALVDKVVAEINRIINSGKSEAVMMRDFEAIFVNYAHVDIIARYVLGPDARTLSPAKFAEYQAAFQGYMARKYGRRFREFIGGKVEVKGASQKKKFVQVDTVAILKGVEPFQVGFMVSDYNGKERFHDMSIEGVSLLSLEQSEVQAMLDKNHGNIDGLIAALKKV